MLEDFDLNRILDIEGARQAILRLLNLVEELAAENRHLREQVQQLRDEINRLKGEQGQPKIKPNKQPAGSATTNHSSERERHQPKVWHKASKVDKITVEFIHNKAHLCYTWHPVRMEGSHGCHYHREDITRES